MLASMYNVSGSLNNVTMIADSEVRLSVANFMRTGGSANDMRRYNVPELVAKLASQLTCIILTLELFPSLTVTPIARMTRATEILLRLSILTTSDSQP